ncbi:MAG: peptidylprolyl isomerase [Christensenellaceae bacterium]
MKKFTKIALSLMLTLILAASLCACQEVDGSSKIQRMNMEVEFLDENGEVTDTQTVQIKLYLNYAPKTCRHFMDLCEKGYYDNTVISNVKNAYIEFGGYTYADGGLKKNEKECPTVEGEFEKNGVVVDNNKGLSISNGALVLKRPFDTDDGVSQYDNGKGEIAIVFNGTNVYNKGYFCAFGMLDGDDGSAEESSDSTDDSAAVDRSGMSSFSKMYTVKDLAANDKGDKTYYYEKDGNYYSLKYDDNETAHYYKGETELLDDELTDFRELLTKDDKYFLVIPYTQVRIKTIKKA